MTPRSRHQAPADPPAVLAQQALAARLSEIAPLLVDAAIPAPADDPAVDSAIVFDLVVAAVEADPRDDRIWLLLTALSAAYPTRADVDRARRRFELDDPLTLRMFLLDSCLERVQAIGSPLATLELVIGQVLVDVDHSAKFDLHTGIQRVVRNLLPEWQHRPEVVAAVWTARFGCYRGLRPEEGDFIYRWATIEADQHRSTTGSGRATPSTGAAGSTGTATAPPALLVPWRSVVMLAEVPASGANERLACLASQSGNALVGIAYDAIPVVSADKVPTVESTKFIRYLPAIKFAARMAGISAAATAELQGFVTMLPTQGLTGPEVREVSLPAPSLLRSATVASKTAPSGRPMVLAVGSHEPRKNHLAVLHAAEILWREGLHFTLEFIGGSGWGEEFPRLAADLKAAGRPVTVRKSVTDADLDRAFRAAAFTLFPSLHEGYGLPVAESLAHGTPVITSDFGSMAEIARDGGAVMIDPHDDAALTDAMRTLLTDPARLETLRAEIARRPTRTWAEYADELWESLVAPARSAVTAGTTGTAGGGH